MLRIKAKSVILQEPDSHCNVVLLGTLEESDWELAFAALEAVERCL